MAPAVDRYFVWEVEGLAVYHGPPPKLANPKDFERDEIEFKRGESIAVSVPTARFTKRSTAASRGIRAKCRKKTNTSTASSSLAKTAC